MSEALWSFRGYVTEAGGRLVEEWYWDDLTEDERDAIRDRIQHLQFLPSHMWKEPYYERLGEIGEIKKKKMTRGALRIYGCAEFPHFVMLHGVLKKVNNDTRGKAKASSRYKNYMNGKGSSHGFDFEKRLDRQDSEKQRVP